MTKTEKSIIKALAYFNIFNYPLGKEEIFNFLDTVYKKDHFEKALESLCEAGIIHRVGDFYSLQKSSTIAERRRKGNEQAITQLKIAEKIARFLYRFPFVRGVAVSGSLSKNYADKNSDIDFFIITSSNRLWLARTLMHLFKKLTFLIGRQHWFCMNYYVDELALEIKEKNIFTAAEIVTVLPLCGDSVFRNFFIANKWAKTFFPLYTPGAGAPMKRRGGILKAIAEKLIDNKMGDWLNTKLMKVTKKRWNRKAERHERSYRGELMGLDGDIHYAKPDPANFQKKILHRYERECENIFIQPEKVGSF